MNWFSEDGQSLSQAFDWQQCRGKAREERLSAFLRSVQALDADGERRESESLCAAWQAERTALHTLGQTLVRELPRAESFFVGDHERARAHAAVCRFYTLAEPRFARMGELNVHMRTLYDRAQGMILREDGALRELLLAKHAADQLGEPDLRERLLEIAERLYRVREQNTALRRELEARSAAWFAFCTARFPAITARIGECADLENEGRACNPRALAVLCAELVQLLGGEECGT